MNRTALCYQGTAVKWSECTDLNRGWAPAESASSVTKNKLWMLETNGINGEEKGITANRLDPVERVAEVLKQLLATLPA